MKKALNLILIYFIFLFSGIIAGTVIYSFYLNVLNYIAGREIILFRFADLLKSFFFIAYCMTFLICPIVSYYRIRHPGGFAQTIAYFLICIITWCGVFPGVYLLNNYCDTKFPIVESHESLSEGYFREVDGKVYYFTKDFESENGNVPVSSVVTINTSEAGGVEYSTIRDLPSWDFNKKAAPYREIQVKENFTDKSFRLPIDFMVLIENAKKSFSGLRYLLCFASLVLLICSLYGITSFFDWKLLNTVFLFFSAFIVLCVNTAYYFTGFEKVISKITNNSFFNMLGKNIDEPLLFVINLFVMLVFIVLGIVKFGVHKHREKER